MSDVLATLAAGLDKPLTVDSFGAARLLGISRASLYRHKDRLPAPFKIGSRTLWTRESLLAYLREKTGKSA